MFLFIHSHNSPSNNIKNYYPLNCFTSFHKQLRKVIFYYLYMGNFSVLIMSFFCTFDISFDISFLYLREEYKTKPLLIKGLWLDNWWSWGLSNNPSRCTESKACGFWGGSFYPYFYPWSVLGGNKPSVRSSPLDPHSRWSHLCHPSLLSLMGLLTTMKIAQ